jgi:phosphomannomutase
LALEIYAIYQEKNMDFVDILEQEIFPKYGWWFGKTESFVFNDLEWQKIVQAKMDIVEKYARKTIGGFTIRDIKWNKEGDCLDWILNGDSWIRFRVSGTEPKFKIYYNLYAKGKEELANEYKKINDEFIKLLK